MKEKRKTQFEEMKRVFHNAEDDIPNEVDVCQVERLYRRGERIYDRDNLWAEVV